MGAVCPMTKTSAEKAQSALDALAFVNKLGAKS
jgi:hypothetical protein